MGAVLMNDPIGSRTCMRDRIRDVLVTRILDGTYPAGTRLKELILAREFGVSQAPIREALRELEGSGLVKSERYRGTRVRGADYREIREAYELRGLMEERALQLAAPFTAEFADELTTRTRSMARALEDNDPERYIDEALTYHRRLIEASGNETFVAVWDFLYWKVRGRVVLRTIARADGRGLRPFLDLHRALSARIRAGDARGATEKVRAILQRVTDSLPSA